MTAPLPERALSRMERGLWETDLGAPLNFTTVAKVRGPLTAEALRAALPAVRARHPHLRERIERDIRRAPVFRTDSVKPLVLSAVPGTNWVQALETELNTPIDSGLDPLARFTLVSNGPDEHHVLATLHHAVGDGLSGVYLMRDLIQAAAQACQGQSPQLDPLAEVGSVEDQLPAGAWGVGAIGNNLRFLSREAWLLARHGGAFRVRRDQDLFAHSRRARVLPRELNLDFSTGLTERCRAERTTVHGALSAAMILGVLADARLEQGCVTFGSPANVRDALEPKVGEQVGFYVSLLAYRAEVRSNTKFWDLARAVRRQIEADQARGGELSLLGLMSSFGGWFGVGKLGPRALVENWERRVPSTTALTNLGRLSVEPHHGPLTIEACHFGVAPSALGDFVGTATSLHGRIFWNFVWPDPVLTEPHAVELVDGIVARLTAAVA